MSMIGYWSSTQPRSSGPRAFVRSVGSWKDRLLLAFVVLFGIAQWLIPGSDEGTGSGSVFTTLVWFFAYFLSLRGLNAERTRYKAVLAASQPLIAIGVIIMISTLWSVQPILTLRRGIELLGTSAIALNLVLKIELDEFIETLSFALTAAAIASAIAIAVIPGIANSDAGWQGIFVSKNLLGAGMLTGLFSTAVILSKVRGFRRILLLIGLPILLFLFIGSKPVGAWISGLVLLLFIPVMLSTRAKWLTFGSVVFLMMIVSVVTAIYVLSTGFSVDDLWALFGKDSTLTGRADVWRLTLDAAYAKPLLGYGYAIFWGPQSPAANLVYPGIFNHWEPESAHNGFLEMFVNLGLLGEVMLVVYLLHSMRRAFQFFRKRTDLQAIWPWCVVLTYVVFNLSEQTFFVYNSVEWILFLAAYYYAISSNSGSKTVHVL